MPHHNCPDKDPAAPSGDDRTGGRLRVPFTTGILVGIGENSQEIVDSIFALAAEHRALGAIQEVIVQNFRAKANTLMRRQAEPLPSWFARVVALARSDPWPGNEHSGAAEPH